MINDFALFSDQGSSDIVIHMTCIGKAPGSIPGVQILMDFRGLF